MAVFNNLPPSLLQMLAIFLSIIIEALPFVLLGAVLSGFIEVFLTIDMVEKYLSKNKFLRILFGTFVGFVFPSCECGIVPIVSRFLEKKVPSYTAIPFMATAPVINPIVLFATFSAFGGSWRILLLRLMGASLVAMALGIMLGFVTDDQIVKETAKPNHFHGYSSKKLPEKIFLALVHAIDDFFDVGRYLVFGSLFAASMQIYIPTRILTSLTASPLVAILIMMLIAFIMSLCSEADAFIGASLLSSFGLAPVLAFLLFGPIIDIKNLLMMTRVFKTSFIRNFIALSALVVILYSLVIGGLT